MHHPAALNCESRKVPIPGTLRTYVEPVHERPVAPRPLMVPAASRVPLDTPNGTAILAAHAAALERGESGYVDPDSGLFVLTAKFLADRGTCCERGCRHCPYTP